MQNPISSRSEWRIDLPEGMKRWRYIPSKGRLIIVAPHREVGEFWIASQLQEIVEGLPLGIEEIQFESESWLRAFRISRVAPGW